MPPSTRIVIGDACKLAGLWLAVTAYNLCKPYHVDDAAHLAIAQWIAAHPMHPMSGILNFGDEVAPIHALNQPPLYFYLLAAWGSLFGYREATMHALQALFALAAILLFHRIARRLHPANALWLTSLLALGPAFLVEQNLMVDVPLLALWLGFFDALLPAAGHPTAGQHRRFLRAALACSAAILVKYSSLVLLPILLIVLLWERRWRLAWIGLLPIAVIAAWSLFNVVDYGGIHIVQRPVHVIRDRLDLPLLRLVAALVALGAVTPFGLLVAVRLVPALRHRAAWVYATAALLGLLLVAAVAGGRLAAQAANQVLWLAFLLNGIALVVGAAVGLAHVTADPPGGAARRPADTRRLVLLLWIAGHLAFYSLFAPFMAVRHVLLVLPALLLAGARLWPARLPRAGAAFGLATSVALSAMLGWADWRFAAFFRDEAATLRASLPAGAQIWFAGGLGWTWYADRAGLQPMAAGRTSLAPGDFLALPDHLPADWRHDLPPLALVRTDHKPLGIGDLFCTAAPARFYGTPFTDFTAGPWQVTRACSNSVTLYRVLPSS